MSIINEEWRSIDGFINYQVSNIGRVRNVNTGKILKLWYRSEKEKYLYASLHKDLKVYSFRISRLVAIEFVPNPSNKPLVDHIDGNRENNCYTNLRWATDSENNINKKSSRLNKTSIYKGVCYCKERNRWYSRVYMNKKKYFLGYFENEIEAAKAYDSKAYELYGDYAYLNFKENN